MTILPAITASSLTQLSPPLTTSKPLIFHNNSKTQDRIALHPQFDKSTVSWTSSIARLCRNGDLPQAAAEFTRMRLAGAEPNHITFVTLLSGCADFPSKCASLGYLVHGYVCKLGMDKENVMVGTAILNMYAKQGSVDEARLVFDAIEVKSSVSWNTMIDGYMRSGKLEHAVDMFDEMPEKDLISWTSLINGFVKRGHFEEALDWFREMQVSSVEPDYVTIIAVLAACANLGALTLGLWVHLFILKQDYRHNVRLSNSLVDMYSKCGCIEYARQVFDKMQKRTLVSWNSVIVGLASNGCAEKALEYFDLMQKEGFSPDGITFTGALTACSHAGLVEEGLHYFNTMKKSFRIRPRIEQYGCLVDLYSRAGRLEDAMKVIENMPMKPNEVVLGSLLAACRTHGNNIGLAEKLVRDLVELDSENDSNYVILSNMYAADKRWDGASNVRRRMKGLGIQKKPGLSSVEIGCCVHEFVSGDRSHDETEYIYGMLHLMSVDSGICGYVTENGVVADLFEND